MNRVVPALSDALRYATRGRHERLHEWMARADPFASRERYRRYLQVQHAFLDCAAAYGPALDAVLLEPLVWRCMALDRDLADLGASVAATSIPANPVEPAHALGWLYVSEGSTLGAALLLREAPQLQSADYITVSHYITCISHCLTWCCCCMRPRCCDQQIIAFHITLCIALIT